MADPETASDRTPATQPSRLLRHPDLLRLLDYWRGKRRGRPMPSRDDIDPVEIGWALSRIFLVDYSPEDGFRYRLAGAEIAAVVGRGNLRGLSLIDFLTPERARFVEQRWLPLVRDRCVVVMSGMIYLAADRMPVGERLLLPLAEEPDGPVSGFLGMTVCEWQVGQPPRERSHSEVEYLPVGSIP